MGRATKFGITVLLLLVLLTGCQRQTSSQAAPQPSEMAPTILRPPIPSQPEPVPAEAEKEAPPEPAPAAPEVQPQTAEKPKPKRKKPVALKPAPPKPETAKPEDKKTEAEVKPADAPPPVPLGALSPAQSAQKAQAATLRTQTLASLKSLNHNLSPPEEETRKQIQSFLKQSEAAEADGDPERALNLANKAHLLCDELVKR